MAQSVSNPPNLLQTHPPPSPATAISPPHLAAPLLPSTTRPPFPTLSTSPSQPQPQSHFQRPPQPVSASPVPGAGKSHRRKKKKGNRDAGALAAGTSVPTLAPPNPEPTLHFPQPRLPQDVSFPQPHILEGPQFPQPQLPASAPAPVSSSSPAPPPSVAPLVQPEPPQLPAPSDASATHLSSSSPNPNEMHKNKLQEYAQRSSIPLPEYRTVNEGFPHAPRFRSTVTVNGMAYSSPNTFSHRKAAEQDVAKLAMECILKKIAEVGHPFIRGDTIFCKSILNEFAVKMDLPKLTYSVTQPEGLIPVFVASVVFNGKTYTGDPGKSKKEAEQLAARAAILTLMGESGFGIALSEIINSKGKLFDALYKVKNSNCAHCNFVSEEVNAGSDCRISHTQDQVADSSVPAASEAITATPDASVPSVSQATSALPGPSAPTVSQAISTIPVPSVPTVSQATGAIPGPSVPTASQAINVTPEAPSNQTTSAHPPQHQFRVPKPQHQFRVPKQEIMSAPSKPTNASMPSVQQPFIAFVPPVQQVPGVVPNLGNKRNRNNKRKANKKARVAAQ